MKRLEIHQTRSFKKQLRALYKAGKKERTFADRAETIITRLQSDSLDKQAECRRTHNGEFRLKDCRKYNLSCGFRLVSLKRENRLIFTCIGSHDDCQRWIENHRECQDEIESQPVPVKCGKEGTLASADTEVLHAVDIYEEHLLARIDEHLLREIFSGFCRAGGV